MDFYPATCCMKKQSVINFSRKAFRHPNGRGLGESLGHFREPAREFVLVFRTDDKSVETIETTKVIFPRRWNL